MNAFDENPQPPSPDLPLAGLSSEDSSVKKEQADPVEPVAFVGLLGEAPPPPPPAASFLPEDLRISWSWPHLILFAIFVIGSIIVIQLGLVVYYQAEHHLEPKQVEQLFLSNPELAVGSNVVWFSLIFLFLYVTLAVLRDRPFWPTLGWKKLGAAADAPNNPWVYFAGGIALAVLVAVVSSRIKTPDHLPIQDLFRSRTGAMLLMAMAVLVAPVVEETVFRGYLYPLFAATCSRIAKGFGADPASAVRAGTGVGIVVTGTLFGFLHGAQLGWTWTLVAMLSTVGIIFTFARARAGTVLASFLLHLGYNSMIAFSAIVSTRGFTQMPPHP
jgi:membrane protease YdiL (CAAX protease family)